MWNYELLVVLLNNILVYFGLLFIMLFDVLVRGLCGVDICEEELSELVMLFVYKLFYELICG